MLRRRSLTFLDESTNDINDTLGFVIGFAVLAAACFLAFIQAIIETRRELYGKHSLKKLLPWTALALVVENATLAAQSPYHKAWESIAYVVQASVAPSLLLSAFDLTYLIYKTRSIPFCGLRDGQTRLSDPRKTYARRTMLRGAALCLFGLGVVINFGVAFEEESTLAGRVGWYYYLKNTKSLEAEEQVQIILALFPMAVVTLSCFYFSLALWRYGSTFSMVVHSSPLNPWGRTFFGTIALGAGQCFGRKWFPILSHVGIFVFLETVLLLLIEVNKDLHAAAELSEFLDGLGQQRTTRRRRSVNAVVHNELDDKPQEAQREETRGVENGNIEPEGHDAATEEEKREVDETPVE